MTADRAPKDLTRFAWLSIAAAVAVISLKLVAYGLSHSVALLSDALENFSNLAAALMALSMLRLAARPADVEHQFGHDKAEYFSSGVEGMLILAAAAGIAYNAALRLAHPHPVAAIGLAVLVSAAGSAVNGAAAWVLLRAGRRYRSITLEADGRHLRADVYSSAAIFVGLGLVALLHQPILDPVIALLAGARLVWEGIDLVNRSVGGLMDRALPAEEQATIETVLRRFGDQQGVVYHALRTRAAGAHRHVTMHLLVPGAWSVQRGHNLSEQIEQELHAALDHLTVITHLEPIEDPASWDDAGLLKQ